MNTTTTTYCDWPAHRDEPKCEKAALLAEIVLLRDALAELISEADNPWPSHTDIGQAVDRALGNGRSEAHVPFADDGVTYYGWDGHDGCGEVWPCSTVRAQNDRNGS